MAETPLIDDEKNDGISTEQILSIEQQIDQNFPEAFREFLLLGGNQANMIADLNNGCFIGERNYWQEIQSAANDVLFEEEKKIEKPFWVFAELDGCEQFNFIHFDEGDDPPVYSYSVAGYPNAGVQKISDSFSQYISQLLNTRKKSGY